MKDLEVWWWCRGRNLSCSHTLCRQLWPTPTADTYSWANKWCAQHSSFCGISLIQKFWWVPPERGRQNKGGVEKTSYFLALCVNISKTVRNTTKVTILMTNRKLHMHFRLDQVRWPWMTMNCYKIKFSQNFALLHTFGRQQRLNEWR